MRVKEYRMRNQKGSSLLFALMVLTGMLFGAIALFRSVDMGTVQAGNLAFKESSVAAADLGMKAAITQLQSISVAGTLETEVTATSSVVGAYYPIQRRITSDGIVCSTLPVTSTTACTNSAMTWGAPISVGSNNVYYIIDRMCNASPGVNTSTSCLTDIPYVATCNSGDLSDCQNPPTAISYRITVKVIGPNNTETYIQSSMSQS